jgi:hypothetical protein
MTNYNKSHSMLIQAAAIRGFKDRTLWGGYGAIRQLIWVQNLCPSCWTQKKSTKVKHTLCPLNLVNKHIQDNKLRENIGFSSR